jgi:hypothetical protein
LLSTHALHIHAFPTRFSLFLINSIALGFVLFHPLGRRRPSHACRHLPQIKLTLMSPCFVFSPNREYSDYATMVHPSVSTAVLVVSVFGSKPTHVSNSSTAVLLIVKFFLTLIFVSFNSRFAGEYPKIIKLFFTFSSYAHLFLVLSPTMLLYKPKIKRSMDAWNRNGASRRITNDQKFIRPPRHNNNETKPKPNRRSPKLNARNNTSYYGPSETPPHHHPWSLPPLTMVTGTLAVPTISSYPAPKWMIVVRTLDVLVIS